MKSQPHIFVVSIHTMHCDLFCASPQRALREVAGLGDIPLNAAKILSDGKQVAIFNDGDRVATIHRDILLADIEPVEIAKTIN